MNIQTRLKRMENQIIGNVSEFCACGTPYFATFVIGGEDIINNACPDCGKPIKPQTRADFVIEAQQYKYETEVIEPKTDFSREEFEEWQNNHVVSKHISYEEHLAEIEKET